MPGQIAVESPVQIFIQQDSHSSRLQKFLAGLLQHGDDLVALHAGEAFEEIVNRIAGLQMIEEALHRNARAGKHRRAAEDFRITLDEGLGLHGGKLSDGSGSGKSSKWTMS